MRVQLQKETQQHQEELKQREEEYSVGKQVLEEEYRKRIQENGLLKEKAEQADADLLASTSQIKDLQEVVSSQQQTIEEHKAVVSE